MRAGGSRTVLYIFSALSAALFIYLWLSWMALGPAFFPALAGQDHFLLGVGVGISMYPTIRNGDYIVVDTTPEDIRVGDIIVYVAPNGEFVGHRVIGVTGDGYIVKGDNNPVPDPWIVHDNQIIGEVENVITNPVLKKVSEYWFERIDVSWFSFGKKVRLGCNINEY